MLFDKKLNKIINVEKIDNEYKDTEREPLENGDRLAIFIAAVLVFVPVLVIFAGLLYSVVWLLT